MAKQKLGSKTKSALKEPMAPLKSKTKLTSGKAIRIFRELQGLSQSALAEKTGLKQTTISGLENERITLGLERAKVIARALKIHPAVLAFPDWDIKAESAA